MAPKGLKVLQIGNQKQFSSVIEDVEMEAQTSPLRKKKNNMHMVLQVQNAQQFSIARPGKPMAASSPPEIERMHEHQGIEMDKRLQTEASKQELISEIKYHFSQEKEEMKALAAA